MKKIIIAIIGALMLTSCGVGSYSRTPITVTIDNDTYNACTVKTKAWRKDRNIKKTAQNTIFLTPGQHNVIVTMNGKEVCNKKVFISSQEHKVIEL